ncbi:MAG: DUF6232 family protein [Chloroflexota bacterium]
MAAETQSYHHDDIVQIEGEWASLGGRHYKIEDINDVLIEPVRTDLVLWAPVVYFFLASPLLAVSGFNTTANPGPLSCVFFLLAVLGLVAVALIAARMSTTNATYIIRLRGTFGTVNAFVCADHGYAQEVAKELRLAISRGGHKSRWVR